MYVYTLDHKSGVIKKSLYVPYGWVSKYGKPRPKNDPTTDTQEPRKRKR